MITKNSLQILAVYLFVSCLNVAFAVDAVYTRGSGNVAIRGYDTVAYFTDGKPAKGSKEFSHKHLGAKWLFSSDVNRKLFVENPDKYMPQYGGYCAYAVANDTTASIKPKVFKIHDDKLYLNYSSGVQKRWLKKMKKHIEEADENWQEMLKK